MCSAPGPMEVAAVRDSRLFLVSWILVVSICVVCGGAVAEDQPEADPEGFAKSYLAVMDCLKRGQPQKGIDALAVLLGKHEGQAYVRSRRAEIADLARRMAFRVRVKQPDPKTLVSGRLLKWKATTGQIKIHYKLKTCGDLEKSKKSAFYYFPSPVRGPCKLEIRGRSYARKTEDSPRIIFGGDKSAASGQEVSWQVTFGVPPYTKGSNEVWLPASMSRYDGDEKTPLFEKEITPAKSGKPYKLTLTVTRSSIVPAINGKVLGRAKKPKDVYGSIGFASKGWTDVIFSGEIEPSWMQAKIDRVVQKQREAFDKSYDPKASLPAWLFKAPKVKPTEAGEAPRGDSPSRGLPAELEPKHLRDLLHVYEALRQEDYGEGHDTLKRMRGRGAPASVCAFIAATLHETAGETSQALTAIRECTKEAPKFLLGWVLKGTLLRRLGRREAAAAAFVEGLRHNAGSVEGYEMASLSMLHAGDLAAARTFTREAAGRGLSSKRLSQLSGVLVKAENGPIFSRRFEHKSRNYHVISDMSKKMCVEASRILETSFTSYRVNFGWVSRDKTRLFKVYLFGGRAGFMNYQKDLTGLMGRPAESAAGLYSGLLKQLLIWNLPTREEMIKTIRHEGFHQYLDRIMPDPPTWLNEGLAVYHEHVTTKSGSLVYGQRISDYIELLGKRGLVPLKDFLFQPYRKFYEGGHKSYAQAWAFLHMLKHGEVKRKALFKALVDDFQTDAAPLDVLRRAFPADLLVTLDKELEAHLAKLVESK